MNYIKQEEVCGECFKEAYYFVTKEHPDLFLVHGSVDMFDLADRHINNHAWAENESGTRIFDPTINLEESRKKLESKNIIYNSEAKYSAEEAVINAVRFGHFGPWHTD